MNGADISGFLLLSGPAPNSPAYGHFMSDNIRYIFIIACVVFFLVVFSCKSLLKMFIWEILPLG